MKNESESIRLTQLTKMLESAPNDAFITYALGLEHQKAHAHLEAITFFQKTIILDASYLAAYYQQAVSMAALGEVASALGILDAGIAASKLKNDSKSQAEMRNLQTNLLIEES